MAAAVLTSSKLTNVHIPDPFHMVSSLGADASTSRAPAASSSRHQPPASPFQHPAPSETRPRTFSRLRNSLEQTLRTTTKSKGRQSVDETGTITSKGKEKASEESIAAKEKSKSSMLSKVSFRRPAAKELNSSNGSSSVAAARSEVARVDRDRDKGKVRQAGYTSFQTPSLRQASMSSPTLHLSSQPFPSPYSQPFALPAASSSNVAALVSPPRAKKSNAQGTNLSHIRSINASSASLAAPATVEQRELVRNASSLLIKEMIKPPTQSGLDPKDYEEVEVRLRSLVRLERVWGKSGSVIASTSQLGSISGAGSGGVSAGGEERERRHFGEALRDGYVLCQLVNKLHPGFIPRIDKREDGFVRTSNVTKFLAACSSLGVPPDDLFNRDDLIEGTPDSMARVAKCIIALLRVLEFPAIDREKIIQGGRTQKAFTSPYSQGTLSRAAASTPNLSSIQRSTSPAAPTPTGRKRISPPVPSLPPLQSDSPNESDSDGSKTANERGSKHGTSDAEADDVLPVLSSSPMRNLRTSNERASIADSTRASIGDSIRASFADSIVPPSPVRQSMASSHMTETTAMSSLLDFRSRRSSDAQNSKFGTLRTMTTEATSFIPSENPSLSPTEAKAVTSFLSDEFNRKRAVEPPKGMLRERKPSETAIVDLTRVIEENEESSASAKAASRTRNAESTKPVPIPQRPKMPVRLGKGKWPDDFIDAFSGSTQRESSPLLDDDDDDDDTSVSVSAVQAPLSASPPWKLAIAGAARSNESIDSLPQFNRRPTHRARHSVDTPGLLPKEALLRRDSSPDQSISPNPRMMLRRSSNRTGANRNGIYIARRDSDDSPARDSSPVPFPKSMSGEHSTPPQPQGVHFPPELAKAPSGASSNDDRPRQPRGRFQSEIDGASSRRKPRPNSYDDAGAKPGRSRFESMVNLGVASGTASASDLRGGEGSAVRKVLIVKEDGKPPTQFQLGNCIGRGQFGAVYRALNLNTGQMVAVKRIGLEGLKEEEIAQLMKEVDLVKSLSHPSIVKYEGMARDEDTLSIVLEYAENGSLVHTLKAFGKLNERLVAGYVVKILEGLHYLHQSDVVHCDLKAANILTTKTGNVKLSDFGVSLNLRAMERAEMKDVAGTPNWMAPEVIELKGASTKSDIWSLGCTVIELLTGRPPYGDMANTMSVMFRIVEDDMPPLPEGCSNLLKDFLKQCFQKEPAMRPDAEMLCEHEWLKQNWVDHKDLRPQDSIPFLRRVSADLQKSEVIRYLAKIEMPEYTERGTPEAGPSSPLHRRMSNDIETISPREHSFVKTTFGKPVICRVCRTSVKRSAVLCEQCSLIAHGKCAPNAPPTCDLRAQLLLYAQYAEETGSPSSVYANPLEFLPAPGTPTTPISEAGMSSRTSVDVPSSPPVSSSPPGHPPSAFKVLNAFKRSRSFLITKDSDAVSSHSLARSGTSSPAPGQQPQRQISRKASILTRRFHQAAPAASYTAPSERPESIASSTASPQNSSLRSATTTSHSRSHSRSHSHRNRPDTVRRHSTAISFAETDVSVGERTDRDPRLSRMTTDSFSAASMSIVNADEARSMDMPGDLPRDGMATTRERRRGTKGDKSGCVMQ